MSGPPASSSSNGPSNGLTPSLSNANNDKGRRYIAQLDEALCNGRWNDVPELSRKVDKHAPERGTLTLTARAEAALAAKEERETEGGQGLSDFVSKLQAAVDADQFHTDDGYCARVCLADIYRRQGNAADALKVLPDDARQHQDGDATLAPLGWLEVCQSKSTYIRAHALDASGGQEKEVKAIHRRATLRAAAVGSRTPALRKWNEKLLFRAAMADFNNLQDSSRDTLNESLASFRAWTSFGQRTASADTTRAFVGIPRRQVWKAHYALVTTILRRHLTYNPSDNDDDKLLVDVSHLAGDQLVRAKTKQFAELKQVERAYEALIIDETKFPKSSESNMEVEEWVEAVIGNWNIFCGPTWTDAELGHGGREAHTRAVLDILYRAATKTFHSTAILRHLFTIHAWLGEFDLAMHAFHSYDEIVTRGKARAEKTGKHEIGFDSDDTAVTTAANAIRILCRYGDRDEAERAIEVAKTLERWMGQHRPSTDDTALEKELQTTISKLHPTSTTAAHRAMGIAEATWARHTHDTDERSVLQIKAIDHLRQAQKNDSSDIATVYALARVLAEARDLQAAISVIRQCIDSDESEDEDENDRERQFVPLWHLLALCLSAKDEHSSAIQACAAAFDQFGDPSILLGHDKSAGLVDQMGSLEKQTLVEIKLTQLALTEMTEGADAAVDATDDILALYTRLFGRQDETKVPATPQSTSSLSTSPAKETSTLRSLAGSVRPKSNRSSVIDAARRTSILGGRKADKNAGADGDAVSNKSQHHLHLPFRSKSLRKSQPPPPADVPPVPGTEKAQHLDSSGFDAAVGYSVSSQLASGNAEQSLREMKHDLPHDQLSAPAGHAQQPPHQDVRLPASHPSQYATPESRVGSLQDEQQRIGLLVKVWLFVAGLYIRAGSHEDAAGAIEEATKLAQKYEISKSGEHSSTNNFYFKGWGGGRSVEGLWAAVFCARADLSLALGLSFDAMAQYDLALAHEPDHAQSIIGVSDLLMDVYEQKMPAEKPAEVLDDVPAAPASFLQTATTQPREANSSKTEVITRIRTVESKGQTDPSPAALNRLAARDRAYLLLSTLTNLGTGWDNSAAWYGLARSYELSKQIEKAKQALWWVVSLEDHKPVRSWLESSAGGYTL